jgi:hypothetical protein
MGELEALGDRKRGQVPCLASCMLQVQPEPAADRNEGKRREQREVDLEEDHEEGQEEEVFSPEDVPLPKLCTEEEARLPGQAQVGQAQVAAKTMAQSPSLHKSR